MLGARSLSVRLQFNLDIQLQSTIQLKSLLGRGGGSIRNYALYCKDLNLLMVSQIKYNMPIIPGIVDSKIQAYMYSLKQTLIRRRKKHNYIPNFITNKENTGFAALRIIIKYIHNISTSCLTVLHKPSKGGHYIYMYLFIAI